MKSEKRLHEKSVGPRVQFVCVGSQVRDVMYFVSPQITQKLQNNSKYMPPLRHLGYNTHTTTPGLILDTYYVSRNPCLTMSWDFPDIGGQRADFCEWGKIYFLLALSAFWAPLAPEKAPSQSSFFSRKRTVKMTFPLTHWKYVSSRDQWSSGIV